MSVHSHIKRAVAATDNFFTLIAVLQRGKAVGLMNRENPRLKNPLLLRWVQSSLSSASSAQHIGSCWLGIAQQFYHDMCGKDGSRVTSKLKQGAHMHQHWGLSAWHSSLSVTRENKRIKNPFLPRRVLKVPAPHDMWELLAGNHTAVLPRYVRRRRIMGLVYVCPLRHKEFEIPTLSSKFFKILKLVFLSEVAHKSFCVNLVVF